VRSSKQQQMQTQQMPRVLCHLVEHTDFIPSTLSTSIWVATLVVVHRLTHVVESGFPHGCSAARTHCTGSSWHPRGTSGSGHVCCTWMRGSLNFSIVHLCHPTNSTTPESRVLVAVPPAVHSPLDKSSLASQRRVQLRQSPAHRITLSLVLQAIAPILVFWAACPRIDAVFCLKVGCELVRVHRLHVASDGVLHLHPIPRILECNPLHTILILPHHQRSGCRDWTGSRIWVDTRLPARGRR
jgi:hypothetical protein